MKKTVTIGDVYSIFQKYGNLNISVDTPFGYHKIKACDITAINSPVLETITEHGFTLQSSPNHLIKSGNGQFVQAINFIPGRSIQTRIGKDIIKSQEILNKKIDLYDIEVENVSQYYANGIVSHNSTIFSGLVYGLFKETLHPSLTTEDIINKDQGDMEILLDINVGNENYIIERTIDISTKKNQKTRLIEEFYSPDINLYKVISGDKVTMNGDTKWETEAIIRNVFGTADDFKLTSYSQQNQGLELIDDKRGKERKEILSRFLGIDVFQKLRDINKVNLDLAESLMKGVNTNDLFRLRNVKDDELEKIAIKLRKSGDDIDDLKSEKLSLDENLVSLHKDLQPIDNQLLVKNFDQINSEIIEYSNKIQDVSTKITKLENDREGLEKTLEKAGKANELLVKLQPVIDQLIIEEKELSDHVKHKEILESNIVTLERSTSILIKQPWCRERNCLFLQDALKSEEELNTKKPLLQTLTKKITNKQELINSKLDQKKQYNGLITIQTEIQKTRNKDYGPNRYSSNSLP